MYNKFIEMGGFPDITTHGRQRRTTQLSWTTVIKLLSQAAAQRRNQ